MSVARAYKWKEEFGANPITPRGLNPKQYNGDKPNR